MMELILPVLKQMGGRELHLRTNKFSSHNITGHPLYLNYRPSLAGWDNEILARLGDGGIHRNIEIDQAWLGERQVIERERENQDQNSIALTFDLKF
jgi:hypothetical protein